MEPPSASSTDASSQESGYRGELDTGKLLYQNRPVIFAAVRAMSSTAICSFGPRGVCFSVRSPIDRADILFSDGSTVTNIGRLEKRYICAEFVDMYPFLAIISNISMYTDIEVVIVNVQRAVKERQADSGKLLTVSAKLDIGSFFLMGVASIDNSTFALAYIPPSSARAELLIIRRNESGTSLRKTEQVRSNLDVPILSVTSADVVYLNKAPNVEEYAMDQDGTLRLSEAGEQLRPDMFYAPSLGHAARPNRDLSFFGVCMQGTVENSRETSTVDYSIPKELLVPKGSTKKQLSERHSFKLFDFCCTRDGKTALAWYKGRWMGFSHCFCVFEFCGSFLEVWRTYSGVSTHSGDLLCILNDGRLVLVSSYKAEMYEPPQHVMDRLKSNRNEEALNTSPSSLHPLQSHLQLVMYGSASPEDGLPLITKQNSSFSINEWHAAHDILMLAVKDHVVIPSPTHNSIDHHWMQELYMSATTFAYKDNQQKQRVIRIICEAEACGLLKSAAAIVGDMYVAQHFSEEIEALHRAGIVMWRRMLSNERDLSSLTEGLRSYQKTQRYSQLVGIALQLIPIAVGSLSAILSVGAEVAEGYAVKDVVDYVLGFVCTNAETGTDSLCQRVFTSGKAVVSDDSLQKMDDQKRESLEKAIKESGLELNLLRKMFQDEIDKEMSLSEGTHVHKTEASEPRVTNEMPNAMRTSGSASSTTHDSKLLSLQTTEEAGRVPDPTQIQLPTELDRSSIIGMSLREFAELWAFRSVCTHAANDDIQEDITSALEEFLVEESVRPCDLFDMEAVGMTSAFCDAAVLKIKSIVVLPMGIEIRLRKVLRDVVSVQ